MQGVWVQSLVGELMLYGKKKKKNIKKRSNIVTNSINTLNKQTKKMVYIIKKKKSLKKIKDHGKESD